MDQFAPKKPTIFPNSSLINPKRLSLQSTTAQKPNIQYLYSAKSQFTCVKHFPFSERIAVGSVNSLFLMDDFSEPKSLLYLEDPFYFVKTIDIHPSEMLVAYNSDQSSIRVAHTISGTSILKYTIHKSQVTNVSFVPSLKRIVSTSLDGVIAVYDLIKGDTSFKYDMTDGKNGITAMAINEDESHIAVGFDNGKISLFDQRSENGEISFEGCESCVNTLKFHPVTNVLASGDADGKIILWDIRNVNEKLGTYTNQNSSVINIAMKESELWGVTGDGILRTWDTNTDILVNSYNLTKLGLMNCDIDIYGRRIFFSEKNMCLGVLKL